MKQVDELNPNGSLYATTSYQYSALDNLVKVTQDGQQRYFMYDSLSRLIRVRNPEQQVNAALNLTDPLTGNNQWVMRYDYDNNGNLKEKVDARNIKTIYNYDPLNRVTSRSYQSDPTSTPSVSYFYDNQALPSGAPTFNRGDSTGRLVAVTYGGGSEGSYLGYDDLGRVSISIQRTDSLNYPLSYGYNLASGLISQTYPSGKTYRTDYDAAGRLSQVSRYNGQTQEKVYASQVQYSPHGGMTSMTLGNNTVETMAYNSRLQPTKIELRKTDNTLLLGLDYGYSTAGQANNNGNVLTQKIRTGTVAIDQSYEYDALNRLQWAEESVSAQVKWRQTYGYDRFGNRVSMVNTGSEGGLLPTQTTPAVDATTNRLVGHGYDAVGNMTSATGNTYGYDAESRQVSFNTGAASYVYDGDGRRVKKVVGGQATVMVYNASGQLVAEYSSEGPEGSGTSYLTSDHLGSTRLVVQATGAVKRYDYLPFGEEMPSNVSGRGSVTGYMAIDSTRQRFTSKERDSESGLDYFLARYYSSVQGRFTSVDPVRGGIGKPQSWNLYTYVLNNPIMYTDPFGLWEQIAAGVWKWQEGDTWQDLANILHVDKKKLKKAFKGAKLGDGLIVDTNDLNPGGPTHVYGSQITPLFRGVAEEMNRRADASIKAIGIAAAINLAPAALASVTLSGGGITTLGLSGGGGTVAGLYGTTTVGTLESLAASGGPTEAVITNLTQAPIAGRALSVATGESAEALAAAARVGGQMFRAEIPKALIRELERVGLAVRSTTMMRGATGTEIRFLPEATKFIARFFK